MTLAHTCIKLFLSLLVITTIYTSCTSDHKNVTNSSNQFLDTIPIAQQPLPYVDSTDFSSVKLAWLDSLHLYVEDHIQDTLLSETYDTLVQLKNELLQVSRSTALNLRLALAFRLQAMDRQNHQKEAAAIELLKEGLIYINGNDFALRRVKYEEAYLNNLMAISFENIFDFDQAITYYRRSLKICMSNQLYLEAAKDYSSLSGVYLLINQDEKAMELLDSAAYALKKNTQPILTANDLQAASGLLFNLGRIRLFEAKELLFAGDTTNATISLDQGIALMKKSHDAILRDSIESPFILIRIYLNQAVILNEFHHDARYAVTADSSLVILENLFEQLSAPLLGTATNALRLTYNEKFKKNCADIETGLYADTKSFTESLSVSDVNWSGFYIMLKRSLAEYECNCGQRLNKPMLVKRGRSRLKTVATDYAEVNSHLYLEPSREEFGGNWSDLYTILIESFHQLDQVSGGDNEFSIDILRLSDQAKSNALRSSLEKKQLTYSNREVYKPLLSRELVLKTAYEEAVNSSGRQEIIQDRKIALESFYDTLIHSDDPLLQRFFYESNDPVTFELAEIRQYLLNDSTAIIDMFYGKGKVFLNVIAANKERQFVLPTTPAFRQHLREIGQSEILDERQKNAFYGLYRYLLSEALEWLQAQGVKQLILVQDKSLARHSVAYFPLSDPSSKSWNKNDLLCDRFVITYGNSISSLLAAARLRENRSAPSAHWAGFVAQEHPDRLPARQPAVLYSLGDQVNRTKNKYFNSGTDKMRHNATAENLLTGGEDYRYLHLLAHGEEQEQGAGKYVINWANDEPMSGIGLYGAQLKADLTLAIVCHSALGSSSNDEGRKSIGRALLYAGSSAVISGEGILKDRPTAELLTNFYRYWIEEGLSAAHALTMAQREYRKKHPDAEPTDWGGLVYYGLPELYYQP